VEQAGNLAAGGWTPWWRMGGCGCSPNPRVATVTAAPAGGWTPWWRMGGCGCSPNPRVATVTAALFTREQ